MNTPPLTIGLLLLAGILTTTFGADDYERHIQQFASNTPPAKIQAALQALRTAGTNAFPALLAHLKDIAPAEPSFFQGSAAGTPTIGRACFGLLQGQIEGNWPKGFRDYYVLSPETAREWLASHRGLSLQQLRIEAAQQSLKRAEADTPNRKESEFHHQTLKFLRQNLEEAKRNRPDPR